MKLKPIKRIAFFKFYFIFIHFIDYFPFIVIIYNKVIYNIVIIYFINTHTHYIFFIHSSLDGHFGCFHTLATVHSVEVNVFSD